MEGGAVAQACYELSIPYVVIRIVSDSADDEAPGDYEKFCLKLAGHAIFGVLDEFLKGM